MSDANSKSSHTENRTRVNSHGHLPLNLNFYLYSFQFRFFGSFDVYVNYNHFGMDIKNVNDANVSCSATARFNDDMTDHMCFRFVRPPITPLFG